MPTSRTALASDSLRGIHALLRLVQGQWPPAQKVTCAADALRFTICDEYETWLREERGLAQPSIDAFLWEARHFLAWQVERCGTEHLMDLSVGDIDRYMDLRTLKLTRSSLKVVAERLRSLLRYLHRAGLIATDLSPHIMAPLLYAYEGVPSILEGDQIAAVLEIARMDKTPAAMRSCNSVQPMDCDLEKSVTCGSRTSTGEPKPSVSVTARRKPARPCP
jgi:integrase/recombinase XerD